MIHLKFVMIIYCAQIQKLFSKSLFFCVERYRYGNVYLSSLIFDNVRYEWFSYRQIVIWDESGPVEAADWSRSRR
jgi:hypothetical protein